MINGTSTQWGKARAVSIFRAFSMLGSEITLFVLVLRERGRGATYVSVLMAAGLVSFLILGAAPYLLNVNRKPEFTEGEGKIKVADGMKFIFHDRYLRSLAILLAAFLFAAGTINIANLFLLTKVLHASVFISIYSACSERNARPNRRCAQRVP